MVTDETNSVTNTDGSAGMKLGRRKRPFILSVKTTEATKVVDGKVICPPETAIRDLKNLKRSIENGHVVLSPMFTNEEYRNQWAVGMAVAIEQMIDCIKSMEDELRSGNHRGNS